MANSRATPRPVRSPDDEVAEVMLRIARALVDRSEAVTVSLSNAGTHAVMSIRVDTADVGKLIGKQGRTARAIRIIIGEIARRQGRSIAVDISMERSL